MAEKKKKTALGPGAVEGDQSSTEASQTDAPASTKATEEDDDK